MQNDQLVKMISQIVTDYLAKAPEGLDVKGNNKQIPVSISNHHVHLSPEHFAVLFGSNAKLRSKRELSQPGQFACEETVTLIGSKGIIQNVRILGPFRNKTQIEISVSDSIVLGVPAPVRESGCTAGSPGITLVGPQGCVTLEEGCIVAQRHIHMTPADALHYGVSDGMRVCVKVPSPRKVVFFEVLIRVDENYCLDMHLDFDEANAALLKDGDFVEIINFCPDCPNVG